MKKTERTPEDNQRAQLENEVVRLNKKIAKYEAIELKQNRFGLVWLDVPEAFEDDVENKLPILEEVPKLAINSKDGKPTHLLIEGDNYHALTCLNYTHKGKVDVIYIDPPYNTGSDGFKYKDKRILDKFPDGTEVPKESHLRHSYWLSFMKKRLELSKDLLTERGVIFINIDDNEFAQLKILCGEIFGEDNIEVMIWHQTSTILGAGSGTLRYCPRFRNEHEYIVVIYKIRSEITFNKVLKLSKLKLEYGNADNDPRGSWISADTCKGERRSKINGKNYYTYKTPGGKEYTRQWHFSKEEMLAFLQDGRLYFGKDGSALPRLKKFVNEKRPVTQASVLDDVGSNTDGKEDLKAIFGNTDLFAYPKPVSLVERLIQISSKQNSIILDFFAGSGTTGQAVLKLNQEDGGKRQFILVTNNDEVVNGKRHKIMTDVCLPRIKKVIKSEGGSIKYFKTAFVGKNNILKADDADKIELAHNAGGMLAIAENTFDQVETNNFWQIFESPKQYTAVYFREEFVKFDDFVETIKKLKKPVVVYIFSWEKELEFNDFEDHNITIKTIPQPILEIYKQIYNLV
ncbi:MAG: site-specific DNA-methyltransferase [Candidatus Azambacteria bacterium]|nr:site-specific DNA-methyltransferase [Candidatus Azambacteria bacterium]